MKRLVHLFLLCLCGATVACGAETPARKPVIALVVKTLNNPFFIDMQKGAEEIAKEHNIELLVQAAEREIDVERQMQIVENLIQRRVDVLVLVPSGSREIVPVIVKANKANIPVVVVDTRVHGETLHRAKGKIATFVGSDNYLGGKLAGEFAAERMKGQANVAVLEGIAGHETGDARLRGFKDGIAGKPGMKIVASQTANWERDQGFNVFQNMLVANSEIDVLFAANDQMALGAVEAIRAAGKTGKIKVIGFDATDEARIAIRKGAMDASVAQNPAAMGRVAIKVATRLLNGEPPLPEMPVPVEIIK